jgi:hypothetical protein
MAVKELNILAMYNIDVRADGKSAVAPNGDMYPGYAVVRDTVTGKVGAANRADATSSGTKSQVLGLLAEYVGAPAATDMYIDPVGSTYIDPATGSLVDSSNGMYSAMRKQAFSWNIAEHLNNVTNNTGGATGYQGPARGVGYMSVGSKVVVDKQVYGDASGVPLKATAATTDAADSALVYAPGALLTIGAGANSGKLVHVNGTAGVFAVAVVDKFENGLLYITLV